MQFVGGVELLEEVCATKSGLSKVGGESIAWGNLDVVINSKIAVFMSSGEVSICRHFL